MSSSDTLKTIKKTYKHQTKELFNNFYANRYIREFYTPFLYLMSKKFLKLNTDHCIDLTVKYTYKYYSNIINFDEDFYNNVSLDEIFKDLNNEDDAYYNEWCKKLRNVWSKIDQKEKRNILECVQCMVMSATQYFMEKNKNEQQK
jgi:hypothetical protein